MGCGKSATVTTELKPVSTARRDLQVKDLMRAANDISTNITVTSLKIPILDVSLGLGQNLSGGDGNAKAIYVCPGGSTEDDCMVELVGTELSNLFVAGGNQQSIDLGTYTFATISTCTDGGYNAIVTASGDIDGQTYYTKTGSTTLTTVEAEKGPVTIQFSGCRNYSILNEPIVVTEATTGVQLYVDLRNVITFLNGDASAGKGTCSLSGTPAPTDVFFCLDYPNVAGTVSSTTPIVKRYRIERSDTANAAEILGLYFDGADATAPFSGYLRALFDATYFQAPSGTDTFKRAFIENDTLTVTDYGEASTTTIEGNGNFTIQITV